MIIQEPVQAAIWHCLNYYDYKDAVFLAERLFAEVESEETTFLLGTSYYRSKMYHQCYYLLKDKYRGSPQCRYLLAKCAYQLDRFMEAECALSSICLNKLKNFDELVKEFGEIACFALQLIGKICSRTERKEMAIDAYKKSLNLNPFLWSSFTELCNLGDKIDPNAVFQFSSTEIFNTCQGVNTSSMILIPNVNPAEQNSGCVDIMNINNVNNSSSNYILSTPVDQSNNFPILTTPNNNNNNLNNSLVILRGGMVGDHETPLHSNSYGDFDSGTPFRRFKYLSTISPTTPSFGILPISPSLDTPLNNNMNSPSPQTLLEVNQEQKVVKKLKGHVGGFINRKQIDPSQLNSTNRPTVFTTQTGNTTPRAPNSGNGVGQNVRRSSRLFTNSNNYSVKENTKSPNMNKFVQPRSPPRRSKLRITKLNLNDVNEKDSKKPMEKEKIETITSANHESKVLLNNSLNSAQTMAHHVLTLKKQSAEGLMSLLRELGQGYQNLSMFKCKEAIECLQANLPAKHLETSWVQSLIGLAYYELRDYEQSSETFRKIREKDPHRLEFMEIYSSCLWHLQKETEISVLAQDLIAQDKQSPITWCVAGNCFSLHKEHDTAIKFFKRAVQVDPEFVYSYTLLGHELVLTEELDKALIHFRAAIMRDPRHYNAWFGIGTIFSKQEKYSLAELHYKRALRINPRNSVIVVHIGAMQFFNKNGEQALKTLNTATSLDPKNPLARFHRATVYFSLGKHQEALRELEELKEIVPKESVVYYLIGKIHKQLGNVDSALMHFSWATDLDPKGANNQIKDAFESMSPPPGNSVDEANLGANNSGVGTSTTELGAALETVSEESDESAVNSAEFEMNYDSDDI